MIFMVATMIFALAFPTLISSMTGYTPLNDAFIVDQDQIVPVSQLAPQLYVIHDGGRIGLEKDYPVTWQDPTLRSPSPGM